MARTQAARYTRGTARAGVVRGLQGNRFVSSESVAVPSRPHHRIWPRRLPRQLQVPATSLWFNLEVAARQADFVIVEGGLNRIVDTLRKARHCRAIVRENFAWALGYNLCAMPLAALGFVPPWAAATGMSLSSLLVVGNSLRLYRAGSG